MASDLSAARHDELRDLLGAFALGAVDVEEAEALRAHLATCAACQTEMAELWAAVDALPGLVEPMEPPPALRGRIAAAIAQEPQILAVPPLARPVATPPAPPPVTRATEPIRPARWWSAAAPWAAAAALLLLVSAGLLVWNLRLRQEIRATPVAETIALAPTDAAPGASGQVTYLPGERLLLLDVRDLPPLAPDQVYEVWLIGGDGVPAPAGVFDQATDTHAIVVDRDRFDTLAITAEPGPLGAAAPTGEIVATASI